MAPVSGSAYSYAYLAFGELIAFVIGWDLILEYALQAATVSAVFVVVFMLCMGFVLLMLLMT